MGHIDIPPTSRLELQAQIDVVECNRQLFLVEPADRVELALSTTRQAAVIALTNGNVRHPKIARILRRKKAVGVSGGPADPDDHTGMLDGPVLI